MRIHSEAHTIDSLVVGGAFPDAVEGVFFDGDEAIANVDSAVTLSRGLRLRATSPVSSLGSAENLTIPMTQTRKRRCGRHPNLISWYDLSLISCTTSYRTKLICFSLGEGWCSCLKLQSIQWVLAQWNLIKDPGPPLTLDESDEEEGDEVDAEREEGSLEYESTNLVTSQSDPPAEENSDADEDEEGEETEESPRNEVKENEEENDSQEDDAEDAEFDEENYR